MRSFWEGLKEGAVISIAVAWMFILATVLFRLFCDIVGRASVEGLVILAVCYALTVGVVAYVWSKR